MFNGHLYKYLLWLHLYVKSCPKTNLFKMNRFLFRGTLARFLFNFTRFLFKNCKLNKGSKVKQNLILVRNIEVGFSCLFVHYWQVSSFLFDLWTLIQFTIFEEEPCKIEEVWESNLFILKVCFRVYSSLKFQSKF